MSEPDTTLLRKVIEETLEKRGGGGHDGGMEARVAKLESSVAHLERDVGDLRSDFRELRKAMDRDFRLTWGMVIAGVIGLASLMAKGFHWF